MSWSGEQLEMCSLPVTKCYYVAFLSAFWITLLQEKLRTAYENAADTDLLQNWNPENVTSSKSKTKTHPTNQTNKPKPKMIWMGDSSSQTAETPSLLES